MSTDLVAEAATGARLPATGCGRDTPPPRSRLEPERRRRAPSQTRLGCVATPTTPDHLEISGAGAASLKCGNPLLVLELAEGDNLLDLGSRPGSRLDQHALRHLKGTTIPR